MSVLFTFTLGTMSVVNYINTTVLYYTPLFTISFTCASREMFDCISFNAAEGDLAFYPFQTDKLSTIHAPRSI